MLLAPYFRKRLLKEYLGILDMKMKHLDIVNMISFGSPSVLIGVKVACQCMALKHHTATESNSLFIPIYAPLQQAGAEPECKDIRNHTTQRVLTKKTERDVEV